MTFHFFFQEILFRLETVKGLNKSFQPLRNWLVWVFESFQFFHFILPFPSLQWKGNWNSWIQRRRVKRSRDRWSTSKWQTFWCCWGNVVITHTCWSTRSIQKTMNCWLMRIWSKYPEKWSCLIKCCLPWKHVDTR